MEHTQPPIQLTKICKYCKSEIAKDAKICPHCRKRVALGTGGKIIAGFFGFIVLMSVIGGSGSSSSSNSSASSGTSSSVHQGDEGVLRMPDGGSVIVLRTSDLLDEYIKAAVNKDTYGMAEIVSNGGGFIVPSGTKALVIDSSITTRQVRVLEGKFLGQSGWVPAEFVQRN